VRLPDDAVQRLLDAWPVARLATVGPDGAPHLVPIVFARSHGALFMPIDAKPKGPREPKRIRNLRHEPRVSLLLDAYRDDWTRLWWLRVDGEARVLQPARESDPEVRDAVAALRRKYPQYDGTPVLRDPPTLVRIEPRRVRSWCAGPEAGPAAPEGEPPAVC